MRIKGELPLHVSQERGNLAEEGSALALRLELMDHSRNMLSVAGAE